MSHEEPPLAIDPILADVMATEGQAAVLIHAVQHAVLGGVIDANLGDDMAGDCARAAGEIVIARHHVALRRMPPAAAIAADARGRMRDVAAHLRDAANATTPTAPPAAAANATKSPPPSTTAATVAGIAARAYAALRNPSAVNVGA